MNNIENFINEEIGLLEGTGSIIESSISPEAVSLIERHRSLDSALNELTNKFKNIAISLLRTNNGDTNIISGISSCIYIPSLTNTGEYKVKIIGGKNFRDSDLKVNEDTLFDLASVTKLYSLILLFKLEELGFIDLDMKISDVNPDLPNMEDFTFLDLIRMHGGLRTEGNVATASSPEEAYQIFKTLYLTSNDRTQGTYTDFGAMAISDTLEKIMSKELGRKVKFAEIMNMYLLEPLGLKHTMFLPKQENISGTGYSKYQVFDRKARALGRAIGSAGLFATSDDISRLAKNLYTVKYINQEHIAKLGEITFQDQQKGHLGVYVKHPKGLAKTYTPNFYSTGSFAHQGWTGAIATFDPNNAIHQNILVNAIYEDDNPKNVVADKPICYGPIMDGYLYELNKITLLMYLVKQYYEKIKEQNVDVDKKVIIK